GPLPIESRERPRRAFDGIIVVAAGRQVGSGVSQRSGGAAPANGVGVASVRAALLPDISVRPRSPAGSRIVALNAPFQTGGIDSDAAGLTAQRIKALRGAAIASIVESGNRIKSHAAVRGDKFLFVHAGSPGSTARKHFRVVATACDSESFEPPAGTSIAAAAVRPGRHLVRVVLVHVRRNGRD